MTHIDAMKETLAKFIADVESVAKINSLDELAELERRAVNELQLIEIQVGESSRDLYNVVLERRTALRNGTAIKVEEKPVEKKAAPAKKPAKKAKK